MSENTPVETTDIPDPEGAEHLGDPGKKALAAMKQQLREEREARRALEARLAELEKPAEEPEQAPSLRDQIRALLAEDPSLLRPHFGDADQGAARQPSGPTQLTAEDIKNMTPAQLNQARREGRLDNLLGR